MPFNVQVGSIFAEVTDIAVFSWTFDDFVSTNDHDAFPISDELLPHRRARKWVFNDNLYTRVFVQNPVSTFRFAISYNKNRFATTHT